MNKDNSVHITEQNAETIYNIQGGLHVTQSPEAERILRKEKQDRLNAIYSISYHELLRKEMSQRQLLRRDEEIEKILQEVNNHQQIIICGEPGIGKTTLLYHTAEKLSSTIYYSLKGKSPLQTIGYLINRVRIEAGIPPIQVLDYDEGVQMLIYELEKSSSTIIIDDCEQAVSLAKSLIEIEKFENNFIFSSRNKDVFESCTISVHQISRLSKREIEDFLELYDITLGITELNSLTSASAGNPLYLFYYSKNQVQPLPRDIFDYQNRIWSLLPPQHQEIIATISLSNNGLAIEDLAASLKMDSPIEQLSELTPISELITNQNGILQIFHPKFKEFALNYLESNGLLTFYGERLGIYFLNNERIIDAIYLLLQNQSKLVDEFLLDAVPIIIGDGDLGFAAKVLRTKLEVLEDEDHFHRGYIHYHLCHISQLLGERDSANRHNGLSLKYLKLAKANGYAASAMVFKAMNLITKGDVAKAKEIAFKIEGSLETESSHFKAALLVNLSKVFVDISEFEKGANACKNAYDIFKEFDDEEGQMNSLVNLVTCLSQIPGYRDDAEKYGNQLLDKISDSTFFTMEIVVLNALGIISREKGDYEKAREYSSKAIQLCQKYKLKEKVVLNLINYGNILRDEGKLEEAEKTYFEALALAQESDVQRDEGRVYWILGSMARDGGDNEKSLEYINTAIKIAEELRNDYFMAKAWAEKGGTYEAMNEFESAALAYENSGNSYLQIQQFAHDGVLALIHSSNLYSKAEIELLHLIGQ